MAFYMYQNICGSSLYTPLRSGDAGVYDSARMQLSVITERHNFRSGMFADDNKGHVPGGFLVDFIQPFLEKYNKNILIAFFFIV